MSQSHKNFAFDYILVRRKELRHTETIAPVLLLLVLMLAIIDVNFLPFETNFLKVSGTETYAIEVYWDANCSSRAYSIDWGVLRLSEVKKVVVYVVNRRNESFILFLTTVNWNPKNASRYLNFSWSVKDDRVEAGEIAEVIQTLSVSPFTMGISNFGFDIVFEGRKYLGDINGDMTVNILDLARAARAYGSTPQDSRWDAFADLNNDYIINILDLALAAKDFGKT